MGGDTPKSRTGRMMGIPNDVDSAGLTRQELRKLTEDAAARNLHSWKYTPFKARKRPRAEEQDGGDVEVEG